MKKYTFLTRLLLLALFIVLSLDFISSWIYVFIIPLFTKTTIGFTYFGLFVNIIEFFYILWFIEYYQDKRKR